MAVLNNIIGTPLGWLLRLCVNFIGSYGWALVVFTALTKVILFPLSIWVQKNSIKMIQMKPQLNEVEAQYGRDKDRVSELTLQLYKEQNYHPLAGVIPMLIQVPIILGLINVIYNPMQHILTLDKGLIQAFLDKAMALLQTEELGSGAQISVMKMILDPATAADFAGIAVPGVSTAAAIEAMRGLDMNFLGWDLAVTPKLFGMGFQSLVPWLSGFSAFLLCVAQNRVNVLQKEAGFMGRWGMTIFLTLFSLYFASLVPAGVGIYWICGNLFAIVMMLLVNALIPPAKYIDYPALEESKKHLAESKKLLKASKPSKEAMARAKKDYKRFTDADNVKKVVFYSEGSGFYKYFRLIIEALLRKDPELVIHYVTSDPNDVVFTLDEPRLVPYFIDDNRLIMLFMLVDADIVLMTMPDLQTFHLKRSYMRKDMEYIYLFHGIMTSFSTLREHALDAYDTILFAESNQRAEFSRYLEQAGMEKTLVDCGYGVLDDMLEKVRELRQAEAPHERPKILIGPSWQPDNVLESCLLPILEKLTPDYDVTIRPHPQYIRRFGAKLQEIKEAAAPYLGEHCRFEEDFSSNATVYTADILITDWSGIAYEYAFATERPVLFVHTPMKIVNEADANIQNAERPDLVLRNVVGRDLQPETVGDTVLPTVQDFIANAEAYRDIIVETRSKYIYNLGHSGEVAADYILGRLKEYDAERQRLQDEITV